MHQVESTNLQNQSIQPVERTRDQVLLQQQRFKTFFKKVSNLKVDYQYIREFFDIGLESEPLNRDIDKIVQRLWRTRDSNIKSNWSADEKKILIWVVGKYTQLQQLNVRNLQNTDFEEISQLLPRRDFQSVKNKWLSMSKQTVTQQPFSAEEDQKIVKLYNSYKHAKQSYVWTYISQEINKTSQYFRSGRQLRDRWINYLDPKLENRNKQWKIDEDYNLIQQILENGLKWVEIAKVLKRNEYQVKNRYHALLRREKMDAEQLPEMLKKLEWKLNNEPEQDNEQQQQIHDDYAFVVGNSNELQQLQNLNSLTPCLVDMKTHQIYFCSNELILDAIYKYNTSAQIDINSEQLMNSEEYSSVYSIKRVKIGESYSDPICSCFKHDHEQYSKSMEI